MNVEQKLDAILHESHPNLPYVLHKFLTNKVIDSVLRTLIRKSSTSSVRTYDF